LIANRDGKMIVGESGSFIHGFREAYEGTIEDGDIFLTTDPYSCAGAISHANDWLVLVPVFEDGRLVAGTAMFGHMTDIGGKVPGSLPTDARQIPEEGIVVPPAEDPSPRRTAARLAEPHPAQLPAARTGTAPTSTPSRRRLPHRRAALRGTWPRASATTSFTPRWKTCWSAPGANDARLHRAQNVPERKQSFEDFICDDGMGVGPYRIACTMWREGERVIFDFEGTAPRSGRLDQSFPQRGNVQDVLRRVHDRWSSTPRSCSTTASTT
jgi:N-methylhydantoinase B